jgi:hypothetical protein
MSVYTRAVSLSPKFQDNKETRDNWIGPRLNRPETRLKVKASKPKEEEEEKGMAIRVWGR